ncbi:MAG: hypothetical protein GWN18_17750, partial [Thermoplasmata archaeon]|nr:hypothetical protein [Thermoplasmata archaeon]NIS13968.1 hypothetical protein [Thermoplasmata archaeon]NIS21805.1 hypothetical protein [Thermoplasmata archaeon]NIT79409.1 hypothetical protein [Thermoplasmata archaeon]NIU50838.1 hypothetical protein [Thermoplasmata archaeon]
MRPSKTLVIVLLAIVAIVFAGLAIASEPADAMKVRPTIKINGKWDMAAQGFPGSGTAGDPFVIEGYEVNATGYGVGIYVGNVSNVVIRDNYVHGAASPDGRSHMFEWDSGIALFNVQGFTIANNWVEDNDGHGIHLESVFQGEVTSNSLVGNGVGLYVSS